MARGNIVSARRHLDGLAEALHNSLMEATEEQRAMVSRELELISIFLGWADGDIAREMGDDDDDKRPGF